MTGLKGLARRCSTGGVDSGHRLLFCRILDDCGLDAKLQLCLCSAVELLVDRRIVAVKGDVGTSAVGIAFEDDLGVRRNGK